MTAMTFEPYMESVGSSDGERWGYVRTRPEASMFWWLYHSTHPDGYVNRPLVIWLQVGLLLTCVVDVPDSMFHWLQAVNIKYVFVCW